MIRSLIRCGVLLGVVGTAACEMEIANPNQPETDRVLATARDVENLLGTQYLRWHIAMYGSLSNVWGMAQVMSFEDFSSLANNGMGARISIPRAANDNSVGNGYATEQSRTFFIHSEVTRITSNVLAKLAEPDFTLGSPAQDNRARAFAQFMRGLAHGYLALVYDSAAVVTPEMSTEDPGELADYREVMDTALSALTQAITYANTAASGANGFPLPASWIPGPTSMTATEFVKLARSYRARLRASVARTPQERAAVNWDEVIADAANGITANHYNTTNTVSGPFNTWVNQWLAYTTWHQMTPFVIGMADNSGAYAAWIATPLANRGAGTSFFMVTPDQRFPQGATRAEQQADFALTQCTAAASVCKRYFVNRPTGNDQFSGASWGWSNYDHARFYPWRVSGSGGTGQNGDFPFMTVAEINLLEAEGHYRKGNYAQAAALINKTRARTPTASQPGGGLPPITDFDATSPVPGGNNCVPKVPVGPSFTTIACGNMLEALKWEKRIETAYSHFMAWFLDMRGWGDLPEGTPTDWATPYQDLQARGRSGTGIYSTGTGGYHQAAKGTYGW
ncbi:MAG TPA: RagB/SusD family nutrient uptake outer membrane protein [Gemmatimonadales bacterium]